jgi:hypothetical protein
MIATIPKPVASQQSHDVTIKSYLHRADSDATILAGSSVLSSGGLCPPFESCPNQNLFQQFFGIEFIHEGHTHVCAISTYEFAHCFGLVESIQYRLSHERHKFGLDASMPGRTSAWLFKQIHSHLVYLHDANSKVFLPNQFAARAATIQTLISGAICTRLPSKECWVQAYANDSELCAVRELGLNPSLISNETLLKVNHNFRGPLRHSLISVEDDMLIFREPISGSDSYRRLTLVPRGLYNILFIAFHANPIGGHLNAYPTLYRLRLRYYWPGMYAYVKRMCHACLVARSPIPLAASLWSLYRTFQSRLHFWLFTLMRMPLAIIPVSKDPTCTSLAAAECAVLPAWNPLLTRLPPLSHQQL